MAALTSANVRDIAAWVEGEVYSKRRKAKRVEVHGVTLTAADGMPAAAFGMTVIEEMTPAYYKGGTGAFIPVPNADGSIAYLWGTTDGTTAAISSQAISATPNGLFFTVKGY